MPCTLTYITRFDTIHVLHDNATLESTLFGFVYGFVNCCFHELTMYIQDVKYVQNILDAM